MSISYIRANCVVDDECESSWVDNTVQSTPTTPRFHVPNIAVNAIVSVILFLSSCVVVTMVISSRQNNFSQGEHVGQLNIEFHDRSDAFINTCLAIFPSNKHNAIFQAYRGMEINEESVQSDLEIVATNAHKADFAMVDLVRIHYLTDDYSYEIKRAAAEFRFWLYHNETSLVYWSENHAILFMSSHWLFNERYKWDGYNTQQLRSRLTNWLHLKITYGFYEFLSKVYMPYTLAALLNLADFAEDQEVATLAESAARRVMMELLMVTNTQGVSYSVAGRDYWKVLYSPYGHNYNTLVYLLTGTFPYGASPIYPTAIGSHLATTSLDMSHGSIYTYWNTNVNIIYQNGHSLETIDDVNTLTDPADRVISFWTSGGCCDVDHVVDTFHMMSEYYLWDHPDLSELLPYRNLSDDELVSVAKQQESLLLGRFLIKADIGVFKNADVVMTSLMGWNSGWFGYQSIPWVASTGKLSIWGSVGFSAAGGGLPASDTGCASNGLPYVAQRSNVLLVVYYPDSFLYNYVSRNAQSSDVVLHWPVASFDEIKEAQGSPWKFARENSSYVGVTMIYHASASAITQGTDCLSSSANASALQAWAIVVGNVFTHGSFDIFVDSVGSAEWSTNVTSAYGRPQIVSVIQVDGQRVEVTTSSK